MSKSYLDRMRKLRGESKSYAATVIDAKPQEKSLKTKNKRRSLTTVVKRSRIAAKKNPKTRSMMRARKAKRRARDARGHFIKKKRTAARNPVKRKRAKRSGSKRVAKRRGVTRIKRALGRKRSNGRFTRRGKHRVRGYRRKVAGRSKKTLVRAHSSYEAAPRKKKRRRSAKEEVMKENPRRRRHRRSGKARRRHNPVMENPRKRKHKRRSPRRRARRRSTTTAVMPAVVRRRTRKGGRRTSPAAVKVVVIRGLSGGGRRKKRRSSSKRRKGVHRRKGAHRRTHKRRSHRRGYTPASHQLVAASEAGFFENPLGGYALENPLSGGELALAAGTAAVGYILTDFLDRYLAVKQYLPTTAVAGAAGYSTTAPSPVNTVPGMLRIAAQAGLAAAAFAGAHFVEKPMGRAALQGAGLGALTHLLGQLFNHYVMAKIIPTATAGGMIAGWQPMYQQEIQADTAATASGLAGVGFLGLGAPAARPRVLQRPNASIPYREVGPRAVAAPPPAGVGNCVPCMSGDQTAASAAAALQDTGGGTSFVPQGPPPIDQSGWSAQPPSGGNGSNGGNAVPSGGSNGTTPAPITSGNNGTNGGRPTNLGGIDLTNIFPDE
jgi:hypothetical protein